MNNIINTVQINNENGVLTVSSLQIAENFEKQHKHVLETIENLKAENSALKNMFIESTYKVEGNNKTYKCYDISRDGFSLLVMGFTGKKALEWKLKYIEAFNLMEKKIKELAIQQDSYMIENPAERARRWAEEYEEKMKLQATVEEQKPKVAIADTRLEKKGCYSLTDVTKSLHLKRGQITRWARKQGYLHKKLSEVNKKGESFFKVYSSDGIHNQIGVTDSGLSCINRNLAEIKSC